MPNTAAGGLKHPAAKSLKTTRYIMYRLLVLVVPAGKLLENENAKTQPLLCYPANYYSTTFFFGFSLCNTGRYLLTKVFFQDGPHTL